MADAVNGLITAGLDSVPEEVDDALEITAGGGLEIVSLLLDCVSWLASFPDSPGFLGGRPYPIAASRYKVSKLVEDEAPYYWQRVAWVWRSAVLGLDIAMMAGSFAVAGVKVHQRLKRRTEGSILFSFALSAVDFGLTTKSTVAAKPKSAEDITQVSAEYIPMIPDLLGFLRLPMFTPSKGAVLLTLIDLTCKTLFGSLLSGVSLADEVGGG